MLRKIFMKKKQGEVAVEWVILAPVILFIVFIMVMLLIFVMDRTLYSNACSEIAQQMNLGDSGLKAYQGHDITLSSTVYQNDLIKSAGLSKSIGSNGVSITCTNTADGLFEKCFNFHLEQALVEGDFDCPYATLTNIDCKVYNGSGEDYSFNTNPLETESGNMVEVSVTYRFLIFNVTDRGYSFII